MYWLVNFYKMLNDRNFCAMSSDSDKANHSATKKSLSLILRNLWEMLALFVRFFIVPWLDTLQRYKTIFESTNFSLKKRFFV